MTVGARNPNHPVVRGLDESWHKLLVVVMVKLGRESITITSEDLEAVARRPGGTNIVAHEHALGLTLKLVTDAEGERLAQREGGLPT